MKQWLYLLKPTRLGMLTDGPTPEEAGTVSRHFAYAQEPMAISQPFVSREYIPTIQEDKGPNIMVWVIASLALVFCLAAAAAGIFFFMQ